MLSDEVPSAAMQNPIAPEPEVTRAKPAWLKQMLRVEWLGQTAASLCWITSVFVYGISSTGDYLQLGAASAWLIANIAVVLNAQEPE
ncbi:MAG: hypothetical protein AAGF84_11630 [Planctomycetota bacterium]